MDITRNETQTFPGPSDWFTGSVFIDPIVTPDGSSRINASLVHFTPGARTAWHTHPKGQTLWVTQGVGLVGRRGAPVEVIRPGDRVFIAPDEDHWHGATANRVMSHVAMLEVDDQGNSATWGEHVSDDEYGKAPDNG
jgi:quercetin dioxygenase-like cupin family protein